MKPLNGLNRDRVPKIFTSEQIHETAVAVMHKLEKKYGSDAYIDMMIGITTFLVDLGLGSPEDFYE